MSECVLNQKNSILTKYNTQLETYLKILYEETQDFIHTPFDIPQINQEETLTSDWHFEFYKNYVSKNKPLIIKNGCKHFPAFRKWNLDSFRNVLSEKEVTVAITTNGYADGISDSPDANDKSQYFVLPEERKMRMEEFLDHIQNPQENIICYIQRQNSNLHDFPELFDDIGNGLSWATRAFGFGPENTNFWMGDRRAITSMHKDPYENIYCVLDGYKEFILISPTDLPYVPYKKYPIAKYVNVSSSNYQMIKMYDENGEQKFIDWISIDPLKKNMDKEYSKFEKARKYKVKIEKGDILYLPSLWFHHVSQSHGCIAVNFWYDMEFDVKYCYYRMLQEMCSNKAE